MSIVRSLLSPAKMRAVAPGSFSLDDYLGWLSQAGFPLLNQTWSPTEERVEGDFQGLVRGAYQANGLVFACLMTRFMLFSQVRFQYQQMRAGRPGDLFGTPELQIIERPEPGRVTADLLTLAMLDADLSGDWFGVRRPGRIKRLRPDWTVVLIGSRNEATDYPGWDPDAEVVGYAYWPRGMFTSGEAWTFLPNEIAHFYPIVDPLMRHRGMPLPTAALREIGADGAATTHKKKYFENAVTGNLVVRFPPALDVKKAKELIDVFEQEHRGATNAYRCLHPSTELSMWDGSLVRADLVQAGDTLIAWDGTRPVPGRISRVEQQLPSPIVTVTTQRGRVIKTNDVHPFLVKGGRWVPARELRPGDLLVAGLGGGDQSAHDSLSRHQAWVLGALVGDGTFVTSTPVLSAADPGIRARMAEENELVHTGSPGHDYRVKGIRAVAAEAGLMGTRSWEKRIPRAVMLGSAGVKAAFLSGLIDTDGHVTSPALRPSAEIGITSTSRGLLQDAQHLLAGLGINSTVALPMPAGVPGGAGPTRNGVPRGRRRRDAYRLSIFGNDQARRAAAILDLAHARKAQRLAEYAGRPSIQDRSLFDRVVSVEEGPPEPTIGIEVERWHTHVTGGVVTHNTMYLLGGAEATPVGANMQQLEFKATQGAGETRVAAALNVRAEIVGLSEGMQGSSLNAGNLTAVKGIQADKMLRPSWGNFAGSLETIVPPLPGTRLWYDERDVPFLAEDIKVAADVLFIEAQAMRQLGDGGWDHDAVVDAVTSGDLRRLAGQHTGLVPVQLQTPGSAGAVALAARRDFWPVSGDWVSAQISRGDLFAPDHPLVGRFPSLFEPVASADGRAVRTWSPTIVVSEPDLPRLTAGPEPIVSREAVVAKRDELEAAGQPAGYDSLAKALNVSAATIRRRLGVMGAAQKAP